MAFPGLTIPLFSILLVNYNGIAHLDECLGSIFAQKFSDCQVVLVDNASRDGSVAFVKANYPRVEIVEAPSNLGFAGGNNHGLRYCKGRYVFFLNNDTKLESGALESLQAAVTENSGCRVFSCLMLNYRDPELVDNAGDVIYRAGLIYSFSGYPASLFTNRRLVNGACGGAAVYAASLLEEIGGFDEDFFLIFEDVDLSLRAFHHGEQVLFLPDVRVHHKGSASIGGRFSPTAVYYSSRNFLPLFVKNFPAFALLAAIPGIAFSLFVRSLQTIRHRRAFVFLRGLRDGIGMLPAALRARKRILSGSKRGPGDFRRALRRDWFRERLAFKRKDFRDIP